MFEEFLGGWYEKLKSYAASTMTVKLQKDIDTYKVSEPTFICILPFCSILTRDIFWISNLSYVHYLRGQN